VGHFASEQPGHFTSECAQNPFQPAKLASTLQALSDEALQTGMSRAAQILFQTSFAGAGTGGAGELTPEEKRKRKKKKRPNF